ncbi:MAG: response regulator [Desulfobulbaceae bacterium]|nr:response regulator [Candidatus Kapabacteria bacterium]MBS4000714.1 response regulator [Desulfobulbaceae bacterium]MBS4001319.1 response regulator [Desulfobulbaceae bacterium]
MKIGNLTDEQMDGIDFSEFTVLIVDDDETFRKFLEKIIGKFLKAKVVQASNPKDAFEIMEKSVPDLMILDLQMPVMDGMTALHYIRTNDSTSDIPVIICTALGFESLIVRLSHQKISAFIVKPVTFEIVLEKIYNVLVQLKPKEKNDA